MKEEYDFTNTVKNPFIFYSVDVETKGHYYKIIDGDKISYVALSLTIEEMKKLKQGIEVEEISKEEWTRAICED